MISYHEWMLKDIQRQLQDKLDISYKQLFESRLQTTFEKVLNKQELADLKESFEKQICLMQT